MKRSASVTLVSAISLFLALTQPSAALAITKDISGDMDDDYFVDYQVGRTITIQATSIWFKKTDGPGLWMQWYRCGATKPEK